MNADVFPAETSDSRKYVWVYRLTLHVRACQINIYDTYLFVYDTWQSNRKVCSPQAIVVLKDYKSGKSIDCGSCKHSTDFEQPFFKAGWRFIEVLAEGTAKMLITIRDSIL